MRTETYIYGVSSKDGQAVYVVKFDDLDEAQAWLETEEYDFRDRELCTRKQAEELAGSRLVGSLDYI